MPIQTITSLVSTEPTSTFTGEFFEQNHGEVSYKVPIYEMNGHRYFLDCIPVEKLMRDEEAQPRQYDAAQAKGIAKSVQRKVLMQPLLVRYDKSQDNYLITEGQHRWRGLMDELGYPIIPCIVYLDMDRALALLCGIEANEADRARGLSGGDFAWKVEDSLRTTRELLEEQRRGEHITETEVFRALGVDGKARIAGWLTARMAQQILDREDALIRRYVSAKQDKNYPVTVTNFGFFLRQICRTSPVDEGANFRDDEVENIVQATNILAEELLVDKWNPEEESAAHEHTKNICRRHPLEALGYFVGKILDKAGAGDVSRGAAYARTDGIDWDRVRAEIANLAASDVWDVSEVYLQRSIEDIKDAILGRIDI